jgi:hypothetical protein
MYSWVVGIEALLTSYHSKGYATLDYEDAGWKQSHLSKLQLLVNRQPVDAICKVVHSSQVDRLGKQWVTKFKEHVDRQHFGKSTPVLLYSYLYLDSSARYFQQVTNAPLQRLSFKLQRVTVSWPEKLSSLSARMCLLSFMPLMYREEENCLRSKRKVERDCEQWVMLSLTSPLFKVSCRDDRKGRQDSSGYSVYS